MDFSINFLKIFLAFGDFALDPYNTSPARHSTCPRHFLGWRKPLFFKFQLRRVENTHPKKVSKSIGVNLSPPRLPSPLLIFRSFSFSPRNEQLLLCLLRRTAVTAMGALYEKLGRLVGRSFEDAVETLLKLQKGAESVLRNAIMLTLEKIVIGLGAAGQSAYRDIYKAARSALLDRALFVRAAAARVCYSPFTFSLFSFSLSFLFLFSLHTPISLHFFSSIFSPFLSFLVCLWQISKLNFMKDPF